MKHSVSLIALLFAACSSSGVPPVMSTPAPAGALDCATAQAVSLGYVPKESGAAFVNMDNRLGDQMVVTYAGGTLTINLQGAYLPYYRVRAPASNEAMEHAASILTTCGG